MDDPGHVPMRREDRRITDESWIKDMLRYEPYCTVGMISDDGPYVYPTAFLYDEDEHAIYVHGAGENRAFSALRENPDVCLNVFAVGQMRGHERIFEFFLEHAGVTVFGSATPLTDGVEKSKVMQAMAAKYVPHLESGVDYKPASLDEIAETTVVRIDIASWTGRMKWTDDDPPFRFDYDEVRDERRRHLPWQTDGDPMIPLTAEWSESRGK